MHAACTTYSTCTMHVNMTCHACTACGWLNFPPFYTFQVMASTSTTVAGGIDGNDTMTKHSLYKLASPLQRCPRDKKIIALASLVLEVIILSLNLIYIFCSGLAVCNRESSGWLTIQILSITNTSILLRHHLHQYTITITITTPLALPLWIVMIL